MKKFLFKIIIFFTVTSGLFILPLLGSNYYLRNFILLKAPQNTTAIVVGHSHPQNAFNDSLINNFFNFSETSESYFYTYFKLKKIIKDNPSIKTVFVDFSINENHPGKLHKIWGDNHLKHRYQIFSPLLDLNEHKIIFNNNRKGFFKKLPKLLKHNIKTIVSNNLSYTYKLGRYKHLERDKTDSLIKAYPSNKIKKKLNDKNLDTISLLYLDKMIAYCKSKKVDVLLIRSPLHKYHKGLNDSEVYDNLLKKRYAHIPFLDFKNLPLQNNHFGDFEHLNHKGTRLFSIWFNHLLEEGLLNTKNKQELIYSKTSLLNKKQN